jgi:hypothetical protein
MLLKQLSRTERLAQLKNIITRSDVQLFNMYHDYYRGIHFIKSVLQTTDYGRSDAYRVTTRSGVELYDEQTSADKIVVKSNWCTPIIETIGDFTRGVSEPIMINSKDKEDELRKVWDHNKLDTLVHELAYDCGIFGRTYIRLRRRDKLDPIELKQLDPAGVYEVRNPINDERESVITWFNMSRSDARRLYPQVSMLAGEGEVTYAEEWDKDLVYMYVDGEMVNELNGEKQAKDLNPYGFIPIFEVPGNIYRTSDIHDAIALNDELNITLTYVNEILRYSAFPMLAPKGTFGPDTPILSKKQLEEVEVSPRTILPIPMERVEGGGVDQSIMEHIDKLKQDISVVSGVPMKLLTAEVDGNTTGVALERMLGAVIKQAEVRRSYIRQTVKEINAAILTLLGGKADTETDMVFPEMIKVDMNDTLDEALKKQTLGISRETIFEELGYDYQDEEKKRATELENDPMNKINDELQRDNQGKPK